MYYPKMVVLVEPHCGGLKADKFINLSGFDCSHRVKASFKGYMGLVARWD